MSAAAATETPSSERAGRLSLEQHAGIAVALAEGFAREEVLAQEGLTESAFRRGDISWKVRLADDGREGGSLLSAYQSKRAFAEDWLRRQIEPLDTSLDAWLGFLRAWNAEREPFSLLEKWSLTLADIGRLGRAWEAALARSPDLRNRAEHLRGSAQPPAQVKVSPARLRPFPWSPRARAAEPAAPAPERLPSRPAAEQAPLAIVPALPSYLLEVANREPALPAPHPAAPLTATAEVVLPLREALPFVRGAAAPGPPAAPIRGTAEPPATAVGGTVELPKGIVPKPATPFTSAAAAPAPATAMASPATAVGGTVELPKGILPRPATPFTSAAPEPHSASAPDRRADIFATIVFDPRQILAKTGKSMPVRADTGTSELVTPALGPALPFQRAIPAPPSPPAPPSLSLEQHAALTVELALRPARTAEILSLCGLDAASKAELDRRIGALRRSSPNANTTWERAYYALYARLLHSPWPGPGR